MLHELPPFWILKPGPIFRRQTRDCMSRVTVKHLFRLSQANICVLHRKIDSWGGAQVTVTLWKVLTIAFIHLLWKTLISASPTRNCQEKRNTIPARKFSESLTHIKKEIQADANKCFWWAADSESQKHSPPQDFRLAINKSYSCVLVTFFFFLPGFPYLQHVLKIEHSEMGNFQKWGTDECALSALRV